MDNINVLKKQLLYALLDYYIDLHNKDIEELENVYNKYNQEMSESYSSFRSASASYKNFWDVMIVPNSLKNCFSITDKFVVDNIKLITNNGIGYYGDYKIVYYNKTNYITLINLAS